MAAGAGPFPSYRFERRGAASLAHCCGRHKNTALKQLPVTQTSSVTQSLTAQTSVNTAVNSTDVS